MSSPRHESHRDGTTVEDPRVVEATGLDAVVAQGAEAGGHRSHFTKPAAGEIGTVGTVALVPEVVDAVRLPVIAAGGMADGRGLVGALALGASGILMGTRFVATRESMAPEPHKKALLERSANATTLTDILSGRFARALRNAFTDAYGRTEAPVSPFPGSMSTPATFTAKPQCKATQTIYRSGEGKIWGSFMTSRVPGGHRGYHPGGTGATVGGVVPGGEAEPMIDVYAPVHHLTHVLRGRPGILRFFGMSWPDLERG